MVCLLIVGVHQSRHLRSCHFPTNSLPACSWRIVVCYLWQFVRVHRATYRIWINNRWVATGDLPECMEVWPEVLESRRRYQRAPLLLPRIVPRIILNYVISLITKAGCSKHSALAHLYRLVTYAFSSRPRQIIKSLSYVNNITYDMRGSVLKPATITRAALRKEWVCFISNLLNM